MGSALWLPLDLDRMAFGTNRTGLLRMLEARMPQLAAATEKGYLLAREGRTATQVGPVVAASEDLGVRLIGDAMTHAAGPVVVDVLEDKTAILRMLSDRGFVRERGFMRMLRGRTAPIGAAAGDGDRGAGVRSGEVAHNSRVALRC